MLWEIKRQLLIAVYNVLSKYCLYQKVRENLPLSLKYNKKTNELICTCLIFSQI